MSNSTRFFSQGTYTATRGVVIFAIILAALLVLTRTGYTTNANSAGQYFEGECLEAAQSIDADDASRLTAIIQGRNVDAPGRQHMTLLWYAIRAEKYRAIQILIRQGSRPDRQEVQRLGTPLSVALLAKDTRVLEAMLDGGLSPDYQDADGTSLLQRATKGDKALDITRLLLERGANVNLRDTIGGTALDESVDALKPEIGMYFVEHGADVNSHLTNGSSTAWAVQKTIERLQPGAARAPVNDISVDKRGKLTETSIVPPAPDSSQQGQTLLQQFEQLRTLMIHEGAKFPPDSPAQVRAQIKKDTAHKN